MFFKSNPNLPDGERARIEFHFQQLVDGLGIARLQMPVVNEDTILHETGTLRSPEQIKNFVIEHLNIQASNLKVQQQLALPVKPSSGGG